MSLDFYAGLLFAIGVGLIAWWIRDRVRAKHTQSPERHAMKTDQQSAPSTTSKRQPVRILMSDLTGRAYAVTRYTEREDGSIVASTKHDVTDDVVLDLMAAAWARGWNECNAAAEGASPANPYRG